MNYPMTRLTGRLFKQYQPLLFGILWLVSPTTTSAVENMGGWDQLPGILESIRAPSFAARDFSVVEFGAKPDGSTDSLPAISEAIQKCHQAGGGRVVVPAGDWYVGGPIHLQSEVNLHVQEGATLKFSTQAVDYLPHVMTRFEGTELMNYSPLIYAFEQENIAITGAGTFDGQAKANHWWHWKGKWGGAAETGWKPGNPDQKPAIAKLGEMADSGVPPSERVFGDGSLLRPNFVQPYRCKNVLIEGVTFINSPMWIMNPVLCENVTVRKVTVNSHGPNNDGCNPEACRNVLIEQCLFDTGDDCIAIKSGRNADGRRVGVPSENIIVRNCTMKDGHGGVVLGSEMSGGIRNIFVENCRMSSPHLERAIRLKSNSLRGGFLENMFVRNIEVGEVSDAVLRINLEYSGERGNFPPLVKNIQLESVSSQKSKYPVYLVGLAEHPIEEVQLRNCSFEGAKKPSVIEHVRNLHLDQVSQPR